MKHGLGLVIGKFYPPHRGHKLLIDSATAQSERTVVIVCAKPTDAIPGQIRGKWLREIHPNTEVMVIDDRYDENDSNVWAENTIRWLGRTPDAVFTSEDYGDLRNLKPDLVIACGGDGTLLQAAHRFRGSGIPILGINIGYLGFITSIPGNRVRQEMKRILNAEFVISERTALALEIYGKRKPITGWALNDALIIRGDNPHLISISARVGERQLTNYRCDGLIVATPTGSTAYSLAAGGPIISPECNVLTITPICPQSLTNRSVVVNSTEKVEMKLEATSGSGVVQVDGMTIARATPESVIHVQTSPDPVPIAFLPEINYYDVLSAKLKWRGDGLSKPKYGYA